MQNKFVTKILKNEIFVNILLYTISYGLTLINTSAYWDGWTIYDTPLEDLHQQFVMNGNKIFGYIFQYIFSGPGIIISRTGTFICYLLSALLLRDILKDIKEIEGKK